MSAQQDIHGIKPEKDASKQQPMQHIDLFIIIFSKLKPLKQSLSFHIILSFPTTVIIFHHKLMSQDLLDLCTRKCIQKNDIKTN